MEEKNIKKCSSKKHGEIDAIYYCLECRVYMCNKCNIFHSDLFPNHNSYNLNKDTDLFNNICKETNHTDFLNYYCKKHNELICVKCTSKIKGKGSGQHSDCDISFIEDIKEEKKSKLNQNIKYLEELSIGLEQSINNLSKILDNVNLKKENLEKKIQKIFTKLRNALNEREEELLSDLNKIFDELYFNYNELYDSKKLPNKVKVSLEQGKKIENEWNEENKLIYLINGCINIENNINTIKILNEKIEKLNVANAEIKFNFEEDTINNYIKRIKNFGYLYYKGKDGYKFLKKPISMNVDNNIMLITNNTSPLLTNLLKFNNSINEVDIKQSKILPNLNFQNMKQFKGIIYDLQDSGFEEACKTEEINNYLKNGGNIIITHDQWSHWTRKACVNAKLFGAKIQKQDYITVSKAKIFNNNHPIFTSFYDLYLDNRSIIKISATHKTDTIYENMEEYYKNLLIELEDNKHGEYLLIKEIEKGKIIFWNVGHSYDLTDYEKKLFMNLIYWFCNY